MEVPKRKVNRKHHWTREYALQYARNYYQAHIEEHKEKRKANYRKYREHYIAKTREYMKANPDKAKAWAAVGRQSVRGHLTRLYCALVRRVQIQSSYIGREVDFDKEWFFSFALNSDYIRYHIDWALDGYKRPMAPSVDRIDNNKGYLKTNIQFLTQSQNARKNTK